MGKKIQRRGQPRTCKSEAREPVARVQASRGYIGIGMQPWVPQVLRKIRFKPARWPRETSKRRERQRDGQKDMKGHKASLSAYMQYVKKSRKYTYVVAPFPSGYHLLVFYAPGCTISNLDEHESGPP